MWKRKGIRNVSNAHTFTFDKDSNHVKTVGVTRASVSIDPH